MDFLFEFVFQILFEVVGEFLIDLGFRTTATVLRSRIGRFTISGLVGFGFGVWWGDHLSTVDHRPRLLWVSLAMGAVAVLAALYRQRKPASRTAGPESLVLPWSWPAYRLWGFAILNGALALGITTGWTPPVVG